MLVRKKIMIKKYYIFFKRYYKKLLRGNGSIYSIAMAVALGFFVACFIPLMGHTIIVLLLAYVFKTDKIIAYAATWLANPYTMPFMYPFFCYIGSKIIGTNLSFKHIEENFMVIIEHFSWAKFKVTGEEFLFSFLVGGFVCGLIVAVIGYCITYVFVKKYRNRKGLLIKFDPKIEKEDK